MLVKPTTMAEAVALKKSPAYLQEIRSRCCMRCLSIQNLEAHHIKSSKYSGTGQKAPDGLTIPLCHNCHINVYHQKGKNTFLQGLDWDNEESMVEYQLTLNKVL